MLPFVPASSSASQPNILPRHRCFADTSGLAGKQRARQVCSAPDHPGRLRQISAEFRRRGAACCALLALTVLLGAATAQDSRSKNIEMCNGFDLNSPDAQINGCTALIDAGQEMMEKLAIIYNNRGNAYTRRGEYDRAIEDYDQSLNINPSYTAAFSNRGAAYQKKGAYVRAIEDFDRAIELDPTSAIAFANRAATHEKANQHDRAIRDYDEAIRLKPALATAWNGRCWTRAVMGQSQAALADCEEALRLNSRSAVTLDSRGFTYLKMGQWDAAIDDYSRALQLDPKFASSLYGRGIAKLKKGDRADGDSDVRAAVAIQANIIEEFARYGMQ
jgi:tetratricopeptide (TPR) repeat protein